MMTIVTLTSTITKFAFADSCIPTIRSSETKRIIKIAGRFTMP